MKRTATTLALLAGFGGGCATPDAVTGRKAGESGGYGTVTRPMTIPGVQGPGGEPVAVVPANARGQMPQPQPSGPTAQQPGTLFGGAKSGVQQAGGVNTGGMVTNAYLPGGYANKTKVVQASGLGPGDGRPAPPTAGVPPVPGMGPPGAVAAVGAITPGM